jgi:exodeoxyribonuclease V gamma subunit
MPILRLITSSSQRRLLEALADNISRSPLSPLEKESIVILSNGMARWISMELATRLGVSAGIDFCFPNDLLDRCFKALLPESQSSLPFTKTSLTWRIASQLPSLSQLTGFEQIAAYLGNSRDDRRLMQISQKIADCFDQYTIFRPEMVCAWDDSNDDNWQAQLWRSISKECKGDHRASLLKSLRSLVPKEALSGGALPRRVSLFGISYLPPFHLEALRLLSSYCEVTCYLLNPCGEYWGTILSEKSKARLVLQTTSSTEAEEYYETGNPLLSSLGTLGQEFFETLLDYGFEVEEQDNSLKSTSETLLSTIQSDILTLYDRPAIGIKHAVSAADRSLQIHSCHGPMREMEILYDNLLAQFDELGDLEPRHIVVMIPDIESYAPYISSVFGSKSSGRPPLPYSIADRTVRRENLYVDAFLKILDTASSRFALHEILELLEIPSILRCFSIEEDELIAIKTWLTDCNVRWGLDAEHRAELGFPGYADFSWQAGLDRLFLGYAMSAEDSSTFNGISPYPACAGLQAEALGKLAEFISVIREFNHRISTPHTLLEWADILTTSIAQISVPESTDSAGPLAIAKALNSLREAHSIHGFTNLITLDAVRDHLAEVLAKNGSGYGFMGGAITFCAMLPMRSIPMRVIWLAGMNDGQFPRTERPPGFSLMNGARRRGDRSLRDEDRYLFLEALMAAEDRFCISYNGQNDRDNSVLPPSVLVSELIDYVARGFVGSDDNVPLSVITTHRLQSFSPLYFDGSDPSHMFSYDRESCQAIEARRVSGRYQRKLLEENLPFDGDTIRKIDLNQLRRFLANPAESFLEQRLRIKPFNPAEEPDDSEPFSLDALSRYSISQKLVEQHLIGAEYSACLSAARSSDLLPPLGVGTAAFDSVWEKSRQFADAVRPEISTQLEPLTVTFTNKNIQLHATIENCQHGTNLRWRCAGMKGKDRLAIWLDHLLLNIAKQDGYPLQSMLIASDSTIELLPVDQAAETLSNLLDLYCEGMTRPLPFFAQTSWDFLKEGAQKAERSWSGDQRMGIPGERDNQAVALCWGDDEPWGEEFRSLAVRVYGPLVAAIKKQD